MTLWEEGRWYRESLNEKWAKTKLTFKCVKKKDKPLKESEKE